MEHMYFVQYIRLLKRVVHTVKNNVYFCQKQAIWHINRHTNCHNSRLVLHNTTYRLSISKHFQDEWQARRCKNGHCLQILTECSVVCVLSIKRTMLLHKRTNAHISLVFTAWHIILTSQLLTLPKMMFLKNLIILYYYMFLYFGDSKPRNRTCELEPVELNNVIK